MAERDTSVLDLSGRDDDSAEDFVFTSSVLHNEPSSEDEDTMNEGCPEASSSTSTSFGTVPYRPRKEAYDLRKEDES
ncbi:hypothetical protein MRX96_014648 [Rhipicephalus microplus]